LGPFRCLANAALPVVDATLAAVQKDILALQTMFEPLSIVVTHTMGVNPSLDEIIVIAMKQVTELAEPMRQIAGHDTTSPLWGSHPMR